mgnify:CR=1 FL=1
MKRRDTIVRYTAPERINHWITAFCFILAAVSGLGFLFPSFNWLMQIMGTPQLARILHPFVGVIMFASFIIMFFRYWHHNLINRDDIFWAKNIRKIVVNEEVGDTGRYNFGQKCVFWAAIIFLVLLLVSGVVIWWKRRPQGKFGVPPLRHDLPTWKAGVAIMLALAIAFPLVGASLIAVWALDRLVFSRLFSQRESTSGSL